MTESVPLKSNTEKQNISKFGVGDLNVNEDTNDDSHSHNHQNSSASSLKDLFLQLIRGYHVGRQGRFTIFCGPSLLREITVQTLPQE